MIKYNLKLILRKLRREKIFTIVNLLGLVLGLSAFLAIALYVEDELSFDKFHEDSESIYRVVNNNENWGYSITSPIDYVNFYAPTIPSIADYNRLSSINTRRDGAVLVEANGKTIYQKGAFRTDPNFFQFYGFQLMDGNPSSVFSSSESVVISTSLKEKFFGDSVAIGKEIVLNMTERYIISGIAQDPPKNSTIQFQLLAFEEAFFKNDFENQSGFLGVHTYLKVSEEQNIEVVAQQINESKDLPPYTDFLKEDHYELVPFTEQRLFAPYERDIFSKNDYQTVVIFIGIGLSILILAMINYVNLVTAMATKRVKEIGLRKVVGASRRQLISLQILEAIVMTIFAFVIAFAINERFIPILNEMLNKDIQLNYFSDVFFIWVFVFGIALGLLAGFYPALMISNFKAINLVTRNTFASGKKGYLRKFLVFFQFTISAILLIVVSIISAQMDYLKNKDLGFQPEYLVSFPFYKDSTQSYQTFKNRVLNISGVEGASINGFQMGLRTESGIYDKENRKDEDVISSSITVVYGDTDFIETVGVSFIWKAESYNGELKDNQIIVGQSLAEKFKLFEDGTPKPLYNFNGKLEVVGVVSDFHVESLKSEIQPTVVFPISDWGSRNLTVKVNSNVGRETLDEVGEIYQDIFQRPSEFYFLDQQIEDFYQKEQGQFRLFSSFTSLAIFISLLGLVALTVYSVELKRKEVSIRKVLGASIRSLLFLLNKEYSLLVVLSFLIAIPAGLYAMQNWLDQFVYRVEVGPLLFISAMALFLIMTWSVTIIQSLKVSGENPADVLREE
ncbi:FtsX-like permease family protein [Roseivirga pacifica]|uniref:ABC transporter permease n=1 Tax=Roseivirga pacifica TaxID=1267423 RepID=UPI003BAD2860